ncbi:hypothetical protein PV327_007666 [Microctonus hyperodae]|uniref:CHCH domain-containing protein n=1 Tax=Microctonus hyperodae TaxID=165561 RepID=A0AA39FZY2_MICHY|nr:hypothetical protein PV327_007666 [Microctonus hyperodae]
MGRRGRSAAAPSRPVRRAAPPPARVPAAAPPSTPMMAQPQQPSLMGQMAATAGGVAIGHTIGHAVTGLFSGGGSNEPAAVAAPAAAPIAQQQSMPSAQNGGACAWEMRQFIECAQGQSDLTLCEGFNEALRQCKMTNQM